MYTNESLKKEAVDFIQHSNFQKDNITALWGLTKYWAGIRCFEMGGGYASCGDAVSVILTIDKNKYNFKISLSEIKTTKQ